MAGLVEEEEASPQGESGSEFNKGDTLVFSDVEFGPGCLVCSQRYTLEPSIFALRHHTVDAADEWLDARSFVFWASKYNQRNQRRDSELGHTSLVASTIPGPSSSIAIASPDIPAPPAVPPAPTVNPAPSPAPALPKPMFQLQLGIPSPELIRLEEEAKTPQEIRRHNRDQLGERRCSTTAKAVKRPPKRKRVLRKVKVEPETIEISDSPEQLIKITRQVKVKKVITLTSIPSTWSIPRDGSKTAHLLDLSNEDRDWPRDKEGNLVSMATLIFAEDQDLWTGPGSAGSISEDKAPRFPFWASMCSARLHPNSVEGTTTVLSSTPAFLRASTTRRSRFCVKPGTNTVITVPGLPATAGVPVKFLTLPERLGLMELGCSKYNEGSSSRNRRFVSIPIDIDEDLVAKLFKASGKSLRISTLLASKKGHVPLEVGTQGIPSGQARVRGVQGTWADLTRNVNQMVSKLADQVRPISDVTKDVAAGDLTELVDVDTQGEMLDLKMAVNSAVSQLSAPANEMARVLLEVGTEGILSGQTAVLDVQGMRKALANNVHLVAMNLTNQARSIFQVTKALASVDLTKKTDVGTRGEILELKEAANADAASMNDRCCHSVARGNLTQKIMLSVDTLAGNLTTRVHSFAQISAAAADGDFTRLITVEGEMDSLKTQINQKESTAAHEAAELANRSGSEFLANRSHEIRMSMNGVIDMTDLIDSGLNRPQRESLLLAHSLARSLLLIIDDVLGISNTPDVDLVVEAGRMAVEAVAYSLLGRLRTIKFIPSKVNRRGQVALSTRLLAMDDQSITLEFSAADAGIGIAKDKDNLIFDTFCQAGLGLFISERAVSLMQDNICKCTIIFGDTLQDTTGAEDRIKDLSLRLYLIHEVREVADKDNCRCIDTTCVDLLNIFLVLVNRAMQVESQAPQAQAFSLRPRRSFRTFPPSPQPSPSLLRLNLKWCLDNSLSLQITTPVSAQDLTLSLISALESNPVSPISAPNNVTFAIVHAEDDSVNQKLAVKILKKYGHSVEIVESGGFAVDAFSARVPFNVTLASALLCFFGLKAKMDHHITRPPHRGDLLNAISKLAGANRKEPLMYRPPIAPGPSYA
ncbi:hypothetical protein BKA70DRAFT_1234748 [Coprinopsis sp. MPI-PUGE-AT-0042]|nr:hypothetical protein BKA70DRAFT_1234748 [Coprinopsis sp. MPI-PUGE-AT-0042]